MSKEQLWVSKEMVAELEARKRVLLSEKETLQKAAARIVEIDATIAIIDTELSPFTDDVNRLTPAEVAEPKK